MNSLPLNIDFQQILLHMFNFVLLFGILYFLLYAPVRRFMEKRAREYREIDEKTKENLESAEQSKAAYEEKMKQAQDEIDDRKRKAESELAAWKKEQLAKADAEAEALLEKARMQAQAEKQALMESAKTELAAYVAEKAEQIVAQKTSERYDSFLESAERSENDNR